MIKKLLLVVILLGLAGLLSFRLVQALKEKGQETTAASIGSRRPAVVVSTAKAEIASFEDTTELTGELRPLAQVAVGPKISGRLSQVLFDNGDFVKKGQLLARIDDQEIQQQVSRARAALQVAEAGLKQDTANLENLQSQLRRYERLYAAKLVSLQSLEDLSSRCRAAEAQKELAEAQINQARAALKELEIQQEQTSLFAPMSGYVGDRTLHPGALVSPSSSILSVVDLSRLKTVVAAPEQQLSRLRTGLPARISVDAYPSELFSGTITRISPLLDQATRSAEVEIMIPNRNSLLRAGMFVRVAVVLDMRDSLSIPREALVTRESKNGVFVIDDGKAHFLEVKIGVLKEGKVQIVEGLELGQEIVASGAQFLTEGDAVRRPGEQRRGPGQPGAPQGAEGRGQS